MRSFADTKENAFFFFFNKKKKRGSVPQSILVELLEPKENNLQPLGTGQVGMQDLLSDTQRQRGMLSLKCWEKNTGILYLVKLSLKYESQLKMSSADHPG